MVRQENERQEDGSFLAAVFLSFNFLSLSQKSHET
jgi:hypothetical protein